MQAEIHDGYWAVFDTGEQKTEPGPRLVELIDHRLTEFIDRYLLPTCAGPCWSHPDSSVLDAPPRSPADRPQTVTATA
jgi:hypothetical protein